MVSISDDSGARFNHIIEGEEEDIEFDYGGNLRDMNQDFIEQEIKVSYALNETRNKSVAGTLENENEKSFSQPEPKVS